MRAERWKPDYVGEQCPGGEGLAGLSGGRSADGQC